MTKDEIKKENKQQTFNRKILIRLSKAERLIEDQEIINEGHAYKIDKLESLLHAALGPCPQCNGSGMIYIGSEGEGRSLPDPCETCKGSGKIPLDVADMIEKFKKQARDDLESELTDDVPF